MIRHSIKMTMLTIWELILLCLPMGIAMRLQLLRDKPEGGVSINKLEMSPDGGMQLMAKYPGFVALVAEVGELLVAADAKNFITISMWHPTIGKVDLVVQKASGETVAEQLKRLKKLLIETARTIQTIREAGNAGMDYAFRAKHQAHLHQLQERILGEFGL